MSPETTAEVARISAAIVAALREAHDMTRAGRFDEKLFDLVRHARELCDLLTEVIEGAGDVEARVRDYARTLAAGLDDMERAIAAPPTH